MHRLRLLIIDPQNDFMDIAGAALPVPGAHADMQRLAALVRRLGAHIDDMVVTLDSHNSIGIERVTFWQTAGGAPVPPFTAVTAADVRAGRFVPRDARLLPGVLDYLDALAVLARASGILLLGSSERHYTASKLYPALLAKRPILALFHEASSVVSILQAATSEPSVRVVTYGDGPPTDARTADVASHLRAVAANCAYHAGDVVLARLDDVSARGLARQLAAVFDRVAA